MSVQSWLFLTLAAVTFISLMAWAGARKERDRLVHEMNAEIEKREFLQQQIRELLRTRRRETRDRFLGLIEENQHQCDTGK